MAIGQLTNQIIGDYSSPGFALENHISVGLSIGLSEPSLAKPEFGLN